MLRTISVYVYLFGYLLFSGPLRAKHRKMEQVDVYKQQWESQHAVQGALGRILKISGVELLVKGLDHVPDDKAVLYVSNHRSYFDIVTGYVAVKNKMGFIGKVELRKIPMLGEWMRLTGSLFLDRKDIKQGLQTILKGIEQVKAGTSMWIFPEGTRNESEDIWNLMPFHEGSLKIAEKSGCPVIPVAITGTRDVYEKPFPRIVPGKVTIEFGEPIYIKELPAEQKKRAGAYTREKIAELLKKEQEARRG
ncbi:MAG: lysophospholipid acyltransferase family protein [Brotaphodocola sp.]